VPKMSAMDDIVISMIIIRLPSVGIIRRVLYT
jgi:hypothetical protein